jgi:hypothetical protein
MQKKRIFLLICVSILFNFNFCFGDSNAFNGAPSCEDGICANIEENMKEIEIFILPNGGNNTGNENGFWFSVKREDRDELMEEVKTLAIGLIMRSLMHTHKDVDFYDMFGRVIKTPLEFKHKQLYFIVPKTDFFVWPGKNVKLECIYGND